MLTLALTLVLATTRTGSKVHAAETTKDTWREVQFNMGNDYKTYLNGDKLYIVNDKNYTFNPINEDRLYFDDEGHIINSAFDNFFFLYLSNLDSFNVDIILNDNTVLEMPLAPKTITEEYEQQLSFFRKTAAEIIKVNEEFKYNFVISTNKEVVKKNDDVLLEFSNKIIELYKETSEKLFELKVITPKQKVSGVRLYLDPSLKTVPKPVKQVNQDGQIIINQEEIDMITTFNQIKTYVKHVSNFYYLEKGFWYLDTNYLKENINSIAVSSLYNLKNSVELPSNTDFLQQTVYNLFTIYNDLEASYDGGKTYQKLSSQNDSLDNEDHPFEQKHMMGMMTIFAKATSGQFFTTIYDNSYDSTLTKEEKDSAIKIYVLTENDKLRFKVTNTNHKQLEQGNVGINIVTNYVKDNSVYFIVGAIVLALGLVLFIYVKTTKTQPKKQIKKRKSTAIRNKK